MSPPPDAEVPERRVGVGVRAGSGPQACGHPRPRGSTHLLLTSMRPSRWTAKSCSLCTCFSSSERPYRKWSSPEGDTGSWAGWSLLDTPPGHRADGHLPAEPLPGR